MKVSVLLPGNSANTVCMTSDKVARQQQVGRQAGVRGNLQLPCNWSKADRTGNYKRIPLPHNGALSCLFIEGALNVIHETEQEGNLRLQMLQRNDAQRLIDDNEEQRNLRLQSLRESQSTRIHAETKQQRHDRLQIARDNTALRTEVERNEERQNRLQLLQQNAAMYRENERLQQLQD